MALGCLERSPCRHYFASCTVKRCLYTRWTRGGEERASESDKCSCTISHTKAVKLRCGCTREGGGGLTTNFQLRAGGRVKNPLRCQEWRACLNRIPMQDFRSHVNLSIQRPRRGHYTRPNISRKRPRASERDNGIILSSLARYVATSRARESISCSPLLNVSDKREGGSEQVHHGRNRHHLLPLREHQLLLLLHSEEMRCGKSADGVARSAALPQTKLALPSANCKKDSGQRTDADGRKTVDGTRKRKLSVSLFEI